jgi:16S rRNA (guanine527-N7)-methyltransferase
LTGRSARANVRHPHRGRSGNGACEGHGETRPRTGHVTEDRDPDRWCDVRRRRERSPDGPRRHDRQEECLDRPRHPLPTRVEDLPTLPQAYDDALDAGLREIGVTLSPGARTAIDGHVRLLIAWSDAINLTAIRDPAGIAIRHVADSLTAVPFLEARAIDGLLDLGSGGGFPGMPLAAALPLGRVALVESIAKKAAFLGVAAAATGLAPRTSVLASRAEQLAGDARQREAWPAVTARAVAGLADLIELAFPLLVLGGCLVAWKRGELGDELAAARRAAAALGGGGLDVHDVTVGGLEGHRLVIATKTGRTPPEYPRDPAARRRRPW